MSSITDRLQGWRTRWPLIKRVGIAVFFALVLWLIVDRAREIDWGTVMKSLRTYPTGLLLAAAALSAASYAVYGSYDLIARRLIGHQLSVFQVLRVSFVSYAFNANLGSLVGGFAVRYRLYGQRGLEVGTVTRILVLGLITNWLGYLALAGFVFLVRPIALPAGWEIGSTGLRFLGAAMLIAAAAYLALCFLARQRTWHVRGHAIELPSGRTALLQLALSVLNWALMAAVVWVLLRQRVDPATVLAALMIASVAGVIAHVPAGLGVLEGVFLTLLAPRASHGDILAALLCYRAVYYLAPLCVAAPLYFWMEARARVSGQSASGQSGADKSEAGRSEAGRSGSARQQPASVSGA